MTATAARRPAGLLERVTCPHCWEQFAPQKALWISEHTDLLGDPRLGPDHAQRFLPTRFTVSGEAVDARGFRCHSVACPQCHLNIPRSLFEIEPLFLSIFGAPASGKSYFLAAMTWELRKLLPLQFLTSFADADPVMNRSLNEYEESVFANAQSNTQIPLAKLIRKTEEHGDLYDTVSYGSQTVSYPRPFLFNMRPQPGHPSHDRAAKTGRVVCLYDNAGESFQPGKDTAGSPVTRHLARSRVLFFVFDPLQETRFRRHLGDGWNSALIRSMRQEPILQEAAVRVRRFAGLRESEKHSRPLIVILTKFDAWSHLLYEKPPAEPYRRVVLAQAGEQGTPIHAVDTSLIERQSALARNLLLKTCAEIVTAAEGFAKDVIYVPASALGWHVKSDDRNGSPSICPAQAEPHWATVPLLYALARWTPGLIPRLRGTNTQT